MNFNQLEPTFDMKRQGRILINMTLLFTMEEKEREEIFRKLIVVRAEHLAMTDTLELYAYSKDFIPIEMGEIPPTYHVITVRNSDTGEFERIVFERIVFEPVGGTKDVK